MKAMVLAAGLGTRLRPLTDARPKALVEVAGQTMLQMTLARLRAFGIHEVIVNAHHFAGMIVDYLKANDNFGMRIEVSREEILLDTGGGLKKAAISFWRMPAILMCLSFCTMSMSSAPSTWDAWCNFTIENFALATLAVQDRKSSRYLLFDEQLQLCGRRSGCDDKAELLRSAQQLQALAFCGIHVISPRLLAMMTEEGAFSIIDCYLRLAGQGEKILAFRADEYYWRDLGTPDKLLQAEEDLKHFHL